MERYLNPYIFKDLNKKMVFLGGPRQCGKTTLAKNILKKFSGAYLNWDFDEDKRTILKRAWSDEDQLIIFDELHKFPRWKNWIKGVYDTSSELHRFLVTGSARLDVYRRGGDSLMGRYHYWRLHPLTLDELPVGISPKEGLKKLLTLGGFPEPFLDGSELEAKRWRKERFDRVIKDDIRDLEPIKDLVNLGLFLDALRTRVGSPVVLSNISEDLQVSQKTLKKWLEVLEKMYVVFVVKPFTRKLPRAIQKPPKVYLFDNGDVLGDEGALFENFVATTLLKRIHFLEDSMGDRYELNYIRDKEGREVDFVISKNGVIDELYEVKWSDQVPSRHLMYYSERLKPKSAYQVVGNIKRSYQKGGLSVVSPIDIFSKSLWNT